MSYMNLLIKCYIDIIDILLKALYDKLRLSNSKSIAYIKYYFISKWLLMSLIIHPK